MNILGKGFITSIKGGDFVWQKGTWAIKDKWRLNTPLSEFVFDTFNSN